MNKLMFAALAFATCATHALAEPKDCEELKGEIAAKIDAKGAKSYTLEIVDTATEAEGTVVGSCQAGAKKIVYKRS